MKKTSSRPIRVLLAAMLALALFLPGPGPGSAGAVTQSDIDEMKDSIDEITSQINDLEDKLAGIQDDKSQALQQKENLDQQIALLNQQIAQTEAVLSEYDTLIAEKQTEIDALQAQEEEQYALFCQRVRAMEEQGTVSYLSILFNAASFSDLLDNAMLMGEIMDYDQAIIDQLEATREELEQAKSELESDQAEQQALWDEQAASRAQLQTQQAKAEELVNQILSQESEYQSALAEVEAEEERVQEEIVRLSKELAAQQAAQGQTSNAALGGYIWPVSSRKINSPFGPRNTGIPGASTNHKGVDIGGVGYTTEVHAAKAGTVIVSQRSSSYGEYVVISHGDGDSTLYAHMVQGSQTVSVGDTVTQGQVIGQVGSTGRSTGYHLHFEIRENGSRIDPVNRFSGLTYGGSPL